MFTRFQPRHVRMLTRAAPGWIGAAWLALSACCPAWAQVAVSSSDTGDPIAQAIQRHQPPQVRDEPTLRGLAIVLDPHFDPFAAAADNDASWLLTAHLYHHLKRAGAQAALTRTEERPLAADAAYPADRLAETCRTLHAHVWLRIAVGQPPGPDSNAQPASQPSEVAGLLSAEAWPSGGPGRACVPSDEDLRAGPGLWVWLPSIEPTTDPGVAFSGLADQLRRQIEALWASRGTVLEGARQHRWPQAQPADQDKPADPGMDRRHRRLHQLARSLYPEGSLPPERAEWFAGLLRQTALSDLTAVYFQPRVRTEDGTVIISGATNAPVLVETLPLALQAVGITRIENRMRVLPDAVVPPAERFGVCVVPAVTAFAEPDPAAARQTQLLLGELVWTLDRDGKYMLVQASDGYVGWVPAEAIRSLPAEQFTADLNAPVATLLAEFEHAGLRAPRGAVLPALSRSDTAITVRWPTGEAVPVPADRVRWSDPTAELRARALAALPLLGRPYVFGGRSPFGTDCSGLITNLCAAEGLPMARDAAQQYVSGRLVATPWCRTALRAGDRIYFLDETGKIFHAGIALDEAHFIHASPPAMQISSLRPGDRLYSPHWDRCFLGAKRP